MTDEPLDLDAIEALVAPTTPGPWLTPAELGDPYLQPVMTHEGCYVWPWKEEADMEFAYAARTFVPQLIGELRQARARIDALLGLAERANNGLHGFSIPASAVKETIERIDIWDSSGVPRVIASFGPAATHLGPSMPIPLNDPL